MADPLSPKSVVEQLPEQSVPKTQIEGINVPPKDLVSLDPLPSVPSSGERIERQGDSPPDRLIASHSANSIGGLNIEKPVTSPPQSPTPPKPATWQIEEPKEEWWPEALENEHGLGSDYKHERSYSATFGSDWKATVATKRGRMHAHHGTYREDALCGSNSDKFNFFCVCDGAGSSKLSRIGSEYTARILSELVKKELLAHEKDILKCSKESLLLNLRLILHHCLHSVQAGLLDLASKGSMPPKDFRCTVLTTLHYRHPTGGIVLCGNVGDGFIAVKRKGQPAERIGTSDSGAFSGEVTCFMPDPEVTQYYQKSLEENSPIPEDDIEAYMLCTDGVEDPFFPVHRTVADIYSQLLEGYKEPIKDVIYAPGDEPLSVIRSAEPSVELLKWLGFEKRGENDDRTIALIYRTSLGENSVIKAIGEQDAVLEESNAAIQHESENKASSVRDAAKLRILMPMIVGALLVANAFILGLILGLKIGSNTEMSTFSR